MLRPGFADQQDLLRWAGTLPAKTELPRLMRRLVLETGLHVMNVDFPAAEGVAVDGFDGVARAGHDSPFVPAGLSLWELSAGKSTTKKADDDYAKRTTTPDGSPTAEATYCAVSVRRWRDRRAWGRDRTADGRWRAVRAYGVDDLETWLEAAPITHAWLSELLGLQPFGLRTPGTWWQSWSAATDPPLTTAVVLAGRDAQALDLRERFQKATQLTTLRADSLDEAVAFIAAVLMEDEAHGGNFMARAVFIDDLAAWRRLADHPRELLLVPRTPEVVAEARAATGHHVLVPLVGTAQADVRLEPVDARAASAALQQAGLREGRAEDAGRLARRSLLALRRHLAAKPELHTPPWAAPPVSRLVRGVLLAGTWRDGAAGDQERVSELIGLPYDDVREELEALASAEDPFVTRVDDTWLVVSPFDAWRQLGPHVRPDDLQRLAGFVDHVLLEEDPAADLAPDERWRASWEGNERRHSATLRTGLATTLAALGASGTDVDAGHGSTGADVAAGVIASILKAANDDWTGARWAVLSQELPLLAEAAPDAFLEGVRAGLTGARPLLRTIFRDGGDYDPMFSSSPHTGLLWAMETAAWSSDHFGQAMDLLARLAEIDPGGRLSNRPAESLESILCAWHPETTAGVVRRLEVLDALRRRRGSVTWPLMLELLPESRGWHSPSQGPRFRDWKPASYRVTTIEWFEFVTGLVDRLIEDAEDDPIRWRQVLEASNAVLPNDRERIRAALAERASHGRLAAEGAQQLWEALRALIARHREYADVERAFPEEELSALERLSDALRPADLIEQHRWLFEDHLPDLGDASKLKDGEYDHEGYQAALAERRRLAARAILDAEGWPGVLRVNQTAELSAALGWAVAEVDGGEHDEQALALLADDDVPELASGYLAARLAAGGWAWVEQQLPRLSPIQQGRLLVLSRDYPAAWDRADELSAETAAEFWRRFTPYGLGDFGPVAKATARLLAARRPVSALVLLNLYAFRNEKASPTLAVATADALDALLVQDPPEPSAPRLSHYEFEQAFAFLERHRASVGLDRVARLEWQCLPALGHEPSVPSLHAALTGDPAFFVELVSAVYRRRSDESTPASAQEQVRADNAYRLLSSWTRAPGTRADGTLDGDALRAWVDAVLPLLDAAGRRGPGEEQIGMALAFAPADPDGAWPCVEVRDLLEDLQLERVERALRRGVYNSRGVTSRDPETGGGQERELAQRHRDQAARFKDHWPRTAAVLRGLAESMEHDARRYDRDAERRRKGVDP